MKDKYQRFIEWQYKSWPNLLMMKEPLTLRQFTKLYNKYSAWEIFYVCCQMGNWVPLLRHNKSMYRTFIKWHSRIDMPPINTDNMEFGQFPK